GSGKVAAAQTGSRKVYFAGAFHPCPVYRRALLPSGAVLRGPAIVEQEDTTVAVEPGLEARVDPLGNLLIRRQ
ncbi:MAG: hydantoinase/oxoprolinase family protein, partial [candidate division NC10 bacterium]